MFFFVVGLRKFFLIVSLYGGGDHGLSKFISEAIFIRGNQVLGIIPQALQPMECQSDPPIERELVVSSMQVRISEILNFLAMRSCNFRGNDYICILDPFKHLSIGLLNVNNCVFLEVFLVTCLFIFIVCFYFVILLHF